MRCGRMLLAMLMVVIVTWAGRVPTSSLAESSCTGEGKAVDPTFFSDVLAILNLPPNPLAIKALAMWQPYESTEACWNPLSTILQMPGSANFNCLNEPQCDMGVQNFPDRTTGEQALAATLNTSRYDAIVAFLSLRSFNYPAIQNELNVWGAGDYSDEMVQRWQKLWRETREDAPLAPTNLSAERLAPSRVELKWRDNTASEVNFSIWRWNGKTWSQIATVDSNKASYIDPDAEAARSYYTVCVAGVRDATCSDGVAEADDLVANPSKAVAPPAPRVLITSLSTPVSRGGSAFVRIVTEPGAECSIAYVLPDGKTSNIPSLGQKVADRTGIITWSWVIRSAEPKVVSVSIKCGQTAEARPFEIR